MSETQAAEGTPAKRTRIKTFGRTYDYTNGVVKVEVLGQPDAAIEGALSSLPDNIRNAFALQAFADYIVGSGNDAVRDGGSVEDAKAAIADAMALAIEGKVEFGTGLGLGMSSAPATRLVARALVEEGKTFVQWNGVKHEFGGDVEKAQEAMRALYFDTDERTLANGTKMTGRQFFRQISDIPAIANRLASYKKEKAVPEEVSNAIG